MGVLRIKNLKIKKIFNLLIVFFVNTLLFVHIEQTSQTEVRKQPFKCVP